MPIPWEPGDSRNFATKEDWYKHMLLKENMDALMTLSECAAKPDPDKFKYKEDDIVRDFLAYLRQTYGEHYKGENRIECFDIWIALGDATPTFRNTAMKYLWRYGRKKHCNKNDLFKAMHYVLMCLYNDFYKMKGE